VISFIYPLFHKSAAAKEARQRAAQADARLLKLREASAEAEAAVAWCVSASGGTLVPSPENTPLLLVLHALRKSMKVKTASLGNRIEHLDQ
jgi:hypothetical protein